MNVLFVGTRKILGAPQSYTVHVWEVLLGLQKLGARVTLLDGPFPPADGCITRLGGKTGLLRVYRLLPAALKMVALVAYAMGTIFAVVRRALAGRCDADVVYGRHGLLPSEWLMGRLVRIPVVKEVNGLAYVEVGMGTAAIRGWPLRVLARLERVSLHRADRFITVSPELAECLVLQHGVDRAKVTVIANGANTELFVMRDRLDACQHLGMDPEPSYVLFVGALAAWQGVDAFIRCALEVVAQKPNTRFLIVGDGPERSHLERLAAETGMENVIRFLGNVAYAVVPWYCAVADVCVMPKVPMSTSYSPLKAHEYLACGRPVVATRVPAFHFLEEQHVGRLVDPTDTSEFSQAILTLLRDDALRESMGRRGRDYVVAHASWASVAAKVDAVLREACRLTGQGG